MSIHSKITEEDLIKLRNLAQQQKSQRNLKLKNGILKQTHDIKSAESLSPITKKLDEVKETTEKIADGFKELQPDTPQFANENTPSTHQPIKNNEGAVFGVELQKYIKDYEKQCCFSSKHTKTLIVDGY